MSIIDDYTKALNQASVQKATLRALRIQRIRIALVIAPLVLAIPLTLNAEYFDKLLFMTGLRISFPLISSALFLTSGFGVLMLYLQTGFKKADSPEQISYEYAKLENERNERESLRIRELDRLLAEFHSLKAKSEKIGTSAVLSDSQRAELVTNLKQQLIAEQSDQLFSEFRTRIETLINQDGERTVVDEIFQHSLDRLNTEVRSLGWRGNTNLALGILTTLIGLYILSGLVFKGEFNPKDALDLSAHYIPRVTLVIFIEVFAYFFLRLYKSSLAEIKYFQNEMTNVEAKHIALLIALDKDSKETRAEVITLLAHTERNGILKKGETTVELERIKLEKDTTLELLPKMLDKLRLKEK